MSRQVLERPAADRLYAVDRLRVEVYGTREAMGRAAALDVAAAMKKLAEAQPRISMIFAAAPSQNEVLAELVAIPGLPWDRVTAFHMDEYVGLPAGAPQGFGEWLRERIFDRVRPAAVYYVDGGAADPAAEVQRYSALLRSNPVDLVCMGIGENGHIAFNDPGVADFNDPALIKLVDLDERSRIQQVHDGCFATLDDVPRQAFTLTVPALTSGQQLFCVVPGPTKTAAVQATLNGPITDQVPATILRRHAAATLYVDRAAAGIE